MNGNTTFPQHFTFAPITNILFGQDMYSDMPEFRTILVIWSDIIFDKDQIQFSTGRIKYILKPVKIKGVIESLNMIRQEYFERLYGKKAFRLAFENGMLIKDPGVSPGWNRLMDAIELVQGYYELKVQRKKKGLLRIINNLNQTEILETYEPLLSKTDYLKYLAARLNTEFKLIPVLEYFNGDIEDSFLFRFRNKRDDILVIWENVKPDRATYIFKYNQQKHPDILKQIEGFISSEDYKNKRSLLSGSGLASKKVRQDLFFYKKYPHAGFSKFRAEIEYLIGYS